MKNWTDHLKKHPSLFKKKTVVGLFRQAAACTPEKTALSSGGVSLSFAELEAESNALARAVQKACPSGKEIIAVRTGRTADTIIAILGIWKSGNAFVFLDSDCPAVNNERCMAECGVRLKITPEFVKKALEEEDRSCFEETGGRERLAEVVYTSGTTGNPKGVLISQRNLTASVANFEELGLDSSDRYCGFASLMFVAAAYDIAACLSLGMTLFLIPKQIRKNIEEIADYYRKEKITVTFLPPHMARKYQQFDKDSPLRILLCGSETVRHLQPRSYRILNIYASSEASAVISTWPVDRDMENCPIGKVVHGLEYYVVKEDGKQVKPGETGELLISGPQVSLGYLNQPELTAERYRKNTRSRRKEYQRVFHTGDLVREQDGVLEYAGRVDQMVKIRGYRVELGGIERYLRSYPGIRDAVCMAYPDCGGVLNLVAFYTSDRTIDHGNYRAYLGEFLPRYMIPRALIGLEEFPRNANGKIDRKALPCPPEISNHKLLEEKYY